MKRLTIILLLLTALPVYSQSYPGCGPNDLKCLGDAAIKAMQANPKDPENYYNLGLILQRNGSHKEAVEIFGMYIAIPGLKAEYLADGYNNRGVSLRNLGKNDLAIADYNKALELVPTSPRFATNRANAHTILKKYDLALADYATAIKLDPRFALAYSGRAFLYRERSSFREAIADLTKAIEYNPAEPDNYYDRGDMYHAVKDFGKAIEDFSKYIAMVAGRPGKQAFGYISRGLAYVMIDRREDAVTDFTKAIELDPKEAYGYRARAAVYRQLKKNDLAEADEKKLAELK